MSPFVRFSVTPLKRAFLLGLALVGLVGCSTLEDGIESESYLFLKPEETLYVTFTHRMDPYYEMNFPSAADNMKDRLEEQYFAAMRRLLHAYRFPIDVHLLERDEEPGQGPVLELHAIRWDRDSFGEIELVLDARIERFGVMNKLGVFRDRELPLALSNAERLEAVYGKTMDDALTQMFAELMKHFETPVEEAYSTGTGLAPLVP